MSILTIEIYQRSMKSPLLRADIVHGRPVPDRIYSVTEMAAKVGVSRTPVREALLQLEEFGVDPLPP